MRQSLIRVDTPLAIGDSPNGVCEMVTEAKPESEGLRRPFTKHLYKPEMFVDYMRVEIERYSRYQRGFTVVLIQTPAVDDAAARLEATRAASVHALELVRTCDLVTSFESRGLVATLLTETGPEGARTVFGRFSEQVAGPEAGWTVKMATYPEHFQVIDYLLLRISELLEHARQLEQAQARGGQLWNAVSDVSRSWRDITEST